MIQVDWLDGHSNIVLMHAQSAWSYTEILAAVEQAHKLMHTTTQRVHLIVDVFNVETKAAFSAVSLARYIDKSAPPNHGMVIAVTKNHFYQNLIRFLQRIAPRIGREIYFASNFDEALSILSQFSAET